MFSLQANWVDLVIIIILLYFVLEAFHAGFWVILTDFISFLGSLLISLRFYKVASELLRDNFSLTHSVSNALGFLLTALISEAILGLFFSLLISRLPKKFKEKRLGALALLPSLGQGLILITFVLTLIIALPIRPTIKRDVSDSRIGGFLITQSSGVEKRLSEIFGGVVEDSLTYLTIKPGSKESIPLTIEKEVGKAELTIDAESESAMFQLVNSERKKAGVAELTWRAELVPIARAHATDMWVRKYFSHYSPEGDDVGDRLAEAGIKFSVAGENLALAPTLSTAHTGLMNSEGHRANILSPDFIRMGIGVIDNGIYGKMFVQVFTD